MARKKIDQEITSFDTPWDDGTNAYLGSRIETYIKEQLKVSYAYVKISDKKETDGWHTRFFRSATDYNTWSTAIDKTLPEITALVLSDVILPDTHEEGVSYSVGLATGSDINSLITTDNQVILKLRFTSQAHDNVNNVTENTGETGVLTIQRRSTTTADWSTVGTKSIQALDYDSTKWTDVDITNLMSDGFQQVRVVVKGESTGLTTRFITFASVIKTTLSLEFATQWWLPITDLTQGIPVSYYIKGAVAKTLTLIVSGKTSEGAAATRTIQYNLGSTIYTETPWLQYLTDTSADPVKVLGHGVHKIDAYLTVSNGTTSEHVYSQVFVVADSKDTTPYMLLNNVASSLVNWTQVKLFDYSIYNPAGINMDVVFKLTDYAGTTTYSNIETDGVTPNTKYTFENVMEIDSAEKSLTAYMHFLSGTNTLAQTVGFTVDNSQNFAPTSGADFILNTSKRSNGETAAQSIINDVDQSTVPSTWRGFDLVNDGWITDTDGANCLRIPAGKSIKIDYEAFSDFLNSSNAGSVTIELDYKCYNADDKDTPVLKMCSYQTNGNPLGFEMRPMEACFMTSAKQVMRDQDIMFQENVRTHVAVNIVHNLSNSGINYIRIFINGTINREFEYTDDDVFVQSVNGTKTSSGINIGATGCSIDIFGMKVYKKSLSATNVRQDYLSTLPTSEAKMAYSAANAITGDNGNISYALAKEKYNTLVWTGKVPSYLEQASIASGGTLDINIVGDKSHSGTINNMGIKGQGSSSKGYYKWNHQFAFNADSKWTDGNGNVIGAYYQISDGHPKATKLVSKLNWASSMQSHKMGATALYTDLWRIVVGGNGITKTSGYENVRVSVEEKPFLYFVKASEDAEPEFYGLVTFGDGKGDKATFGYDKTVFPDYLMLEGSDNGKPLTEHRVPWTDDEVTYSSDDESYLYAGELNWDYDLGNLASLTYFKNAFNFVYLHNINIKPYIGTYSALLSNASTLDKNVQYWVTAADAAKGSNQYDLYRYDYVTNTWINAGATKTGGVFVALNLNTQCGGIGSGIVWEDTNTAFINWRIADFRANMGTYYNLSDTMYSMMFCKMIAASDNRAKNIYLYLDPVTHLICWAQDDLDTILLTDNVGRKNKPYYVEEHDVDSSGQNYWNGTANVFFNLMDAAFPVELRTMVNSMLTGMASLGGSVTGCMEKYFFSTQKYFPAVAYNEVARLLYETASRAWEAGTYSASVHPIAQSLGDQLQAELQWWKRREVYMSSFASYGQFAVRGKGCLMFRSILAVNSDGSTKSPTYSFALVPHLWLYPVAGVGQTLFYGKDADGNKYTVPQRVKAGDTYVLSGLAADGNTDVYIDGIDYYKSVGNFGAEPLGETFTLFGERLQTFVATVGSGEVMQFRPTALTCSANNITTLNIEGASAVIGALDLSGCTKLVTLDLKGTGLTSVKLPSGQNLQTINFPAAITSVKLDGMPNLQTVTWDGVANMQSIYVNQTVEKNVDTMTLCAQLKSSATGLSEVTMIGINWTNCSTDLLVWLCSKKAKLTGKITLKSATQDRYLTYAEKAQLIAQYGDIDNVENSLYVSYTTQSITDFEIAGESYPYTLGAHQYVVRVKTGNNVAVKNWLPDVTYVIDVDTSAYAAFTDAATGVLTLKANVTGVKYDITVTMKLMNGLTITKTRSIGLAQHVPVVGDFAYGDGSFDDYFDEDKDLVGIVFMREKVSDSQYKIRIVSLHDIGLTSSNGVSLNTSTLPFGIYHDSNSSVGFNDTVVTAIQDAISESAEDITSIANVSGNSSYATKSYYQDSTTKDGFKVFASGTPQTDFDGKTKTQLIIDHSDKILKNYLGEVVPKNNMELADSMYNLDTKNSGPNNRWWQMYYPQARACALYEPASNAINGLNKGSWHLPSIGELCRMYNFYQYGVTSSTADETQTKEAMIPIFANAAKRAGKSVLDGFNRSYASSSEASKSNTWFLIFTSGNISYAIGQEGGKYYNFYVRPVCQFTFNLE